MRTEDGYIITKCLNGEPEAFGFLMDKYKGSVYAFAYSKLRNFHDAEDVTQEVFIKAYQKLRSLRRWDNFLAWLYSITSNMCKNWIRSRASRPDSEFVEDQNAEALMQPSLSSYRENEITEILREAMDSLPETQRQVLALHYLGGMKGKEIARFLGISPGAVWERLSRARVQLREEMLGMISTTFEAQRLQAGFTMRMVEIMKRIKIHPIPRTTALPWGLSLAAGIIITILSFGPYLSILNPMAITAGSPLPVEAMMLKAGEIPVDILKTSEISVIASKQGDGDNGVPKLPEPHTAIMAAHGEGDEWTKKTDMPTARGWCATSEVNGKIYAIGGLIGIDVNTTALEEYDPVTDTWVTKADMPTQRNSTAIAVVNRKIYVMGGVNAGTCALSTVEEYDPLTDTWTKKANMPAARLGFSASVVNGKIYAVGGYACGRIILSTVEEYDPVNDTWTRKTDMPTKRVHLSTSVVDGRIYAMGGGNVRQGNADYNGLSVVEEYDPVEDEWTKKTGMPTARWSLSTSVVNDRIYAIGGGDRQVPSKTVEEYDPATDTWVKRDDMPTAKGAMSTSVLDGKVYVVGGINDKRQYLSTVEEYTPGFAAEKKSVEAKGKLVTSWGGIKSD